MKFGLPTTPSFLNHDDIKIQRQLRYWAATAVLYAVCVALLWIGVLIGLAPTEAGVQLSIVTACGVLLFYCLIRFSKRLKLTPTQLTEYQAVFAIICTVLGYSVAGPVRGAFLTIFLVTLIFSVFTLDAKKSYRLCLIAITLLAVMMVWMVNDDPAHFRPAFEVIHFSLATSMLIVAAYLIDQLRGLRTRLREQKEELTDALARIQVLATRDELTTLPNRRHMSAILANEEKRHHVDDHPMCIAMIDLDLFKQINDMHGHAVGDTVLRLFAHQAGATLRNTDILARWGGEEFLLFLPNTDMPSAKAILQKIKASIAELRFPEIPLDLHITFSAGLVALRSNESMDDAINRADQCMYQAKSMGRNCIVSSE